MKNYLVILTTLCLMAFASCSSEEGAVYMLRPHEELPEGVEADRSFTKVFLAGTIDMGNSRDWQAELFEEFKSRGGRYIIGSSKSPITLLEMGLHAKGRKLHVICEEDFYRFDNVRITCDYYGVPFYTSMEEFINTEKL